MIKVMYTGPPLHALEMSNMVGQGANLAGHISFWSASMTGIHMNGKPTMLGMVNCVVRRKCNLARNDYPVKKIQIRNFFLKREVFSSTSGRKICLLSDSLFNLDRQFVRSIFSSLTVSLRKDDNPVHIILYGTCKLSTIRILR